MFGRIFEGFKFLHAVLLTLSAIVFFIFWARTKFWLPKYVHILAGIGLIVGLWCESIMPNNASLNKEGPIARFLFALIVPAMVHNKPGWNQAYPLPAGAAAWKSHEAREA